VRVCVCVCVCVCVVSIGLFSYIPPGVCVSVWAAVEQLMELEWTPGLFGCDGGKLRFSSAFVNAEDHGSITALSRACLAGSQKGPLIISAASHGLEAVLM